MSTRSMPRSLMRRSVLGDQGTYELDEADNKSTKSSKSARKGRRKSRSGSLGPNSPTLSQREPRKATVPPRRRASLGTFDASGFAEARPRRSTVDGQNKIRRVRKKSKEPVMPADCGSDEGSKKSRKSKRSLGSRKSTANRSRRAVLSQLHEDDDNKSQRSVSRRDRIAESMSNALVVANADIQMQQRVEALQSKIVELKQEQLDAQTEAMKLNKEKRDLKLELQRSQTVVRELRADLSEKDLTVKERGEKLEALEKAVESQLDKAEDLEEELKRANGEIFGLEDKLQQMELQLTAFEASPSSGRGIGAAPSQEQETDFESKRRERQERRLEQKEKDLEERERKLQRLQAAVKSQNSIGGGGGRGSSSGDNKQLEQDNRMLLKALNREKKNSATKIEVKDAEIQRLNDKITRFLEEQGGDYNAETVKENQLLAEQLDEEKQSHADTVQIKDEKINQLQVELRKLQLDGTRSNPREAETYKNEALELRRQLEIAEQRNQLLEDEIDNWKKKNIGLEDELTELKARINKYAGQAANEALNNSKLSIASDQNSQDGITSDGENSSKRGIGHLWGRVATVVKKREYLSSSNHDSKSDDIVGRSTFH